MDSKQLSHHLWNEFRCNKVDPVVGIKNSRANFVLRSLQIVVIQAPPMQMQTLNCRHKGHCGGCPLGDLTHAETLRQKLSRLLPFHPTLDFEHAPTHQVRDRADLIWERVDGQMHLGLYALNGDHTVDLEACPMMSPTLEAWMQEFRQRPPPGITKGSVRLRVSPQGRRGVWLDFANADVKALFDERNYLKWLLERAFVEVGQRRKALVWREDAPKLIDPEMQPWFETYDAHGAAIPLYGPVGGFSQVGFASNRALVEVVARLATESGVGRWIELFSGNGNFALALAARGMQVEAFELEGLALEGLERSLREVSESWSSNVRASRLDVYIKTAQLPQIQGSGLLVDPPRAGLRQLLKHMESGWLPQTVLYVSCFTETFVQDMERLRALGYETRAIHGVDQFPFSHHAEWVALLEKAPGS